MYSPKKFNINREELELILEFSKKHADNLSGTVAVTITDCQFYDKIEVSVDHTSEKINVSCPNF